MDVVSNDLHTRPGDVEAWHRMRAGLIEKQNNKNDQYTNLLKTVGASTRNYRFLERGWMDPDRQAGSDIEGWHTLGNEVFEDRHEEFIRDVLNPTMNYAQEDAWVKTNLPHGEVVRQAFRIPMGGNMDEWIAGSDFIDTASEVLRAEALEKVLSKYYSKDPMMEGIYIKAQREFKEEMRRKAAEVEIYQDPITGKYDMNHRVHSDASLKRASIEFTNEWRRRYTQERDEMIKHLPGPLSEVPASTGSMFVNMSRDIGAEVQRLRVSQEVPSVTKRQRI